MRTAVKTVKEKSLPTLIKELDKEVSLFVRLNAADERGTVKCISCNEPIWWLDADCCHLKDRDNMATRFYLPNLAPGCQPCNRFDHYVHIEQWEGKLTHDQKYDLEIKSHSMVKFTRPELEEMILEYREKVKELRKRKGL